MVLLIFYTFTKAAKNRTSKGRNLGELFLDIRIYFVIHLQLKSGCYQKCLGSCQFLLAYPYITEKKKALHNQNKYFSIIIFGTKYELFLLPYQITFV